MNNKNNAILTDFTLSYVPAFKSASAFVDIPTPVTDTMSARERRDMNRKKWMNTALDFDFLGSEAMSLCGMKRLGISHIKNEKPCQDNFKIFQDESLGLEIITLADGHGDIKHDLSEYGSDFACSAVIDTVCRALRENADASYLKTVHFKADIVNAWQSYVLTYHREQFPEDLSEQSEILTRYGTTLLFAIHYRGKFYAGRLGDGGIILSSGGKSFSLFAEDDKLGTSTCSMCSDNSHMLLNIKAYNDCELDSVMLMTDGMFDIFTDDVYLFDNMKVFLEGIGKDSAERCAYFEEQYNKYVEYITDDATVCMMTLNTPASSPADDFFESEKLSTDSVTFREHSIKACFTKDGEKYIAIFSKAFGTASDTDEELFGFIKPISTLTYRDYICNIYQDTGADDYKNLYSLFDEMIKNKKHKINDIVMMHITDCLYRLAVSKNLNLFCNNAELLLELIEYSETDKCVRIFTFSEEEPCRESCQAVIAKLLLYLLAGGVIKNTVPNISAVPEILPPSVSDNLLRAGKNRLDNILSVINGISVPDGNGIFVSHQCRNCSDTIWTYKGITSCPVCRAAINPKAVIASTGREIYEYICENTVITIRSGEKTEAVIEAIINPSSGQLGLKNKSDTEWQFPDEGITVAPGKIKGILKDTTLRINEFDFKIILLN